MKVIGTLLLTTIYSLVVIAFGFWWAENFNEYTISKGDESFFEIQAIGMTTFIALIVFKLINKKVSWWFVMTMLCVITVLSVLVTLFITLSGSVGGTTVETLRVYGVVNALLSIIIIYLQVWSKRTPISNHA